MARIAGFHPAAPGSIPGIGNVLIFLLQRCVFRENSKIPIVCQLNTHKRLKSRVEFTNLHFLTQTGTRQLDAGICNHISNWKLELQRVAR